MKQCDSIALTNAAVCAKHHGTGNDKNGESSDYKSRRAPWAIKKWRFLLTAAVLKKTVLIDKILANGKAFHARHLKIPSWKKFIAGYLRVADIFLHQCNHSKFGLLWCKTDDFSTFLWNTRARWWDELICNCKWHWKPLQMLFAPSPFTASCCLTSCCCMMSHTLFPRSISSCYYPL